MLTKILNIVVLVITMLCASAVNAGAFEDGDAAYDKKNYAVAMTKFKQAAAQGEVKAQLKLGFMYEAGEGVAQDKAEAVKWYKLAAAQGHARAQSNLGLLYAEGQGVVQDYAESVKWWKLAATQGRAEAQYNLGVMYEKGQGVVQDYVRAHMWINLAAAQGTRASLIDRDIVAAKMTTQQIAQAQKLARECQDRNYKNCD